MAEKVRLDVLLAERNLAPSREAARRMIMAGEVRIDGEVRDKPGMRVPKDANVQVQQARRFVSRGGEKLAGALAAFPIGVEGRVCADVGASTGGFTDCLLQAGAGRVYAIDVGYGQLDYRLRTDPRVVVMERTNARYVTALPETVSLIVVDASFISLKLLLPVFRGWMTPQADVITLVKPQFEAGKGQVGKGGVVRDPAVHERVLRDVLDDARADGFAPQGLIVSPLKGPAGNIEFLAWLTVGHGAPEVPADTLVERALEMARQAGQGEEVRPETPEPDD
ncbi:MAG TPA: TlyA family RNA methyltransferase [Aggregatilinea sp.]|uniref:TlyA family RNA methyltransferase n=1 Tax=Aggregatilinea sp. TaxID=2806333 RepID=UPI002C9E4F04|nr:TlyA family RNA methyltransferase [Aggregatilinea sp.]HML22527.1 TlyA family RNA methyltransferase [Aggregatilinea sp.]